MYSFYSFSSLLAHCLPVGKMLTLYTYVNSVVWRPVGRRGGGAPYV
jgi:hypothetical protein